MISLSGPQSQPSSGTAGGRGGFIGTKFGVESPQAVQKMLSLVQQSKIKVSGRGLQIRVRMKLMTE